MATRARTPLPPDVLRAMLGDVAACAPGIAFAERIKRSALPRIAAHADETALYRRERRARRVRIVRG
jgi:hypothetical protein